MISIPIWVFALGLAGIVMLAVIAMFGIWFIVSFAKGMNW